ncbi:hypothetical protein [Methanocaldococcus infernus]|uniref:Uncharacterized protein n=1 Tax=Methanocaldococcus infernus (strain DSM 11812 / JCM 15783 / ME) TaxID=573063 RepID=D5VSF6_METIM|nr:hypothetical protein [Methanocaldococcus infernus]ADG13509.1 conserved hypothetical protein [Methanocaldococcus infernus ME]
MKIYRLTGIKALLFLLIFFTALFILISISLVLILPIIIIFLIYILYKVKIKRFFKKLWWRIRRKRIKIKDLSDNGEVKIHFPRRIEVEDEKDEFIKYLISLGGKKEGKFVVFKGYKCFPIYKESYPVNEIISLNYPEDCEAVILGLKGSPAKPKFLYLIPKEYLKRRMSLEEIKRFMV